MTITKVFCINCKNWIPEEYSQRGGKTITGEKVDGVFICNKPPFVDRCYKLKGFTLKPKKSYKQIEEEIKKLDL